MAFKVLMGAYMGCSTADSLAFGADLVIESFGSCIAKVYLHSDGGGLDRQDTTRRLCRFTLYISAMSNRQNVNAKRVSASLDIMNL